MKSTSILLALITVIALAVGGLLLFDPSPNQGLDSGGTSAVEQETDKGSLQQNTMAGSLTPEPGVPEETERATVETDEAQAKRSDAEALEALKAKGPFLMGKVVNELGFAVADANVRVTGENPTSALNLFAMGAPGLVANETTDTSGAFRTSRFGLNGDEVQVRIKARGFIPYRATHRADRPSGDAQLGVMELERGVILAGVVRDANGRPVEGATVRRTSPGEEGMFDGMMGMAASFSGRGNLTDITDVEGRFELGNEPIGEFVVVASHEAFEKARFEGAAPYEGFEKLDLALEFPPSSSIGGIIRGFPTGKRYVQVKAIPIEDQLSEDKSGIELLLQDFTGSGYDAEVAGDGSFLVQGLPADKTFELRASIKEGFMQNLRCSDTIRAKAGQQDVELEYDSGAMVTFRIVDQDTGDKITSSIVRYRWTTDGGMGFQIGAKKREFGTSLVELDELRPSEDQDILAFTISTPGYIEHTEAEVPMTEGEVVDLGIIKMGKAPILRVRVLEAGSGKPLSRARVGLVDTPEDDPSNSQRRIFGDGMLSLTGGGDTKRTNKEGWVELPASNTPTGTLTIRRSGYAIHVVEDVIMPVSGWREEIVNLSEGGELEVLVLDTLGNPVNQAAVRYKSDFGSDGSGSTSKKGKIKFRDLPGGTYELIATRPGSNRSSRSSEDSQEPSWIPAKVVSGVEQTITLRVPQDTVLIGVVTANGLPLGGATVGFIGGPMGNGGTPEMQMTGEMSRYSGGNTTVTDSNGAFELKQLQTGNHRLNIQAGEAVPGQYVAIDLREGENRDTFEVKIGTLVGFVLDASGNPTAGARVAVRHQSNSNQGGGRFMRSIFGGSFGQKTNEDGSFVIKGVPTDVPLVLGASLKGHTDGQSEAVTVAEGKTEDGIKINLGLGASIRVTLTGEPTPFQVVRARLLEAEEGEESQDASKFIQGSEGLLKDLVPGRWEVWIGNRGGDSGKVEVTVRAGEEAQVILNRDS
jgi:protocatechuate 3,4-dioxygenase beta subunit